MKIKARLQIPKVWWRTTDTLWVISDQNNLPTNWWNRVFTLQTSQVMLAPCSAKWLYGNTGGCWCGLRNLSNSKNCQKTAESIWRKPRGLTPGPPRIHPGGYLTACDIYGEGSLTADQRSPSHGHVKNPTNWSITPGASLRTNFLWAPFEWKQWYHRME